MILRISKDKMEKEKRKTLHCIYIKYKYIYTHNFQASQNNFIVE